MKVSWKMTVFVLAAVCAAGYIFYSVKNRVPFADQKPAVSETAPAISLSDISGKMVSLSGYKGSVVLVNFWASWCPPCKSEMPGFQKVLDEYGDKGFSVIGIALDDVTPALIRELGISFPILKINERVKKDYGDISDVPVSFLIGRDGRIVRKVKKIYSEDNLRRDVGEALK